MTTDITTQVRNYNGNNSFIMKMKDAVKKYGSLTQKQSAAVEKIFNNPVEAKAVEMTDDMKKIAAYEGENSFVNELKGKLEKYGKLSDKQISAALNQIQKEEDKAKTVHLNVDRKSVV
jgi:flagellar biosynthesis chaperone FliJ